MPEVDFHGQILRQTTVGTRTHLDVKQRWVLRQSWRVRAGAKCLVGHLVIAPFFNMLDGIRDGRGSA
jgi:hypothetical protein